MPLAIPNLGEGGALQDQAAPDSRDFDAIVAGFARSGVVSGCAVSQRAAGANMSVDVAAGLVTVAGTPVAVVAGNLAVGAADVTNPRFDLVVVDSTGTASVVAGTPAASTPTNSPHFPAIPAASVVLAALYVPAASASVTTALITDKRIVVSGLGLAWRGAWTATTRYAPNDLFSNNGGIYLVPATFVSGASFDATGLVVLVPPSGTYALLAGTNEFPSPQTFDGGFTLGTPNGVSANVWLQSASQGWQGGPKWEFGIDTSNNGGGLDFYLAKAAWRVLLDAATTSGSPTLASVTAKFGTSDVGKTVVDTGIPNGTTILSVESTTSCTMSANATATGSALTVTVGTVNAVGDLFYIANGAGGSPTIGIGVTPPGTSHRLQIAGATADPALGVLRLIGVSGQTGDFLTIADSGNTTLLQVDKAGIMRGSATGLGGVGMALTVGAQVKALQMANSGITAVYGWEFNANTGTTIKFRYETGGKDLLTFDTAGNAVLGPTGLATNSTNGFVHIPYMAGAPTGTPTGFSGHMPITIDTTNSKIWVWTGAAWKGVVVA